MDGPRPLAFVSRAESLSRLPAESRVLPIAPEVTVPRRREVASRPEDLLSPEDEATIERAAQRAASEWYKDQTRDAFLWRGVDLAECFSASLTFSIRDLVKTSLVLERVLDREAPTAVVVDALPFGEGFRAYPYFDALLPLAVVRARERGLSCEVLRQDVGKADDESESSLARAYLRVAARRALSILRTARPLVALGPYPEFYTPVAAAWKGGGEATVAVVTIGQPVRAVPKAHFFVATLDAFGSASEHRESEQFLQESVATLERIGPPTAFGELPPDLWDPLKMELRSRFRRHLADLVAAGLAFDDGLDRASHVLLMETASPLARAFARYALRRHVPVTVMQHGILAGTLSYRQTEADRIAAWGPADAAWFRQNLARPVLAEGTGCPRYDALLDASTRRLPAAVARIHTATDVVMFASQPFVQDRARRSPWTRAAALRDVLEATRRVEEFHLIIKWHPAEHPEPVSASGSARGRVNAVQRADTFALLLRSRVVLAISSTVALEAMYLGRPVVFLGPSDPESAFHPTEEGGGLRALSADELVKHLRALLGDPSYRKRVVDGQHAFLARSYAPMDGRAAERVADFLRGR